MLLARIEIWVFNMPLLFAGECSSRTPHHNNRDGVFAASSSLGQKGMVDDVFAMSLLPKSRKK
jgi:hypothetical protein